MKDQSVTLTEFYRAYLAFAEGEKGAFPFTKHTGLCINLVKFLRSMSYDNHGIISVTDELSDQFHAAGLNCDFPFNYGSVESYEIEMERDLATYNVSRMKWVREHAKL